MRRLLLLLVVCCAPLTLFAVDADDGDAARAARRTTVVSGPAPAASTTVNASRGGGRTNAASAPSGGTHTPASGATRGGTTTTPVSRTATVLRERQVVNPRESGARTVSDGRTITSRTATPTASRTAATTSVTGRGASSTASRGKNSPSSFQLTSGTSRSAVSTASRSAIPSRGINRTSGTASPSRAAGTSAAARSAIAGKIARAAGEITAGEIDVLGTNYQQCRQVFYDCMDEFCANKDSQLKRCACSSRIHDFDGVKKQLADAEEKMLDFSQRLLTVNMDKEDAAAINTATEGELAFQQKDKSESKKLLDEIAEKLKSTSSVNDGRDMSTISWSLNADAAFDTLDATLGATTTSKEGTDLYDAALPVCREMAAEICDEDSLALAESGYQMAIEQDCNIVSKAYDAQFESAREKIRESSALLDMSRLNIYDERNSDDILTCKKKMLAMLSSSTVCGDDLGQCLDTSGQYIDPSTGAAVLTENLSNLANLITAPTGEETWASKNQKYVTYLNSKKKYIEPAMEKCQDIADMVWDEFIEDALSQIKLAQNKKLEDMRQSCTEVTAKCVSNTAKSISDFDSRALSIFGVWADKTVNEMCSSVTKACTALLNISDTAQDWSTGVDEIAMDTTYDAIIKTCREVGKNCIIQTCKSVSGNFGLCEDVHNSVNRAAILNRQACWSEVQNCVKNAGGEQVIKITDRLYETSATGVARSSTRDTTPIHDQASEFYQYVQTTDNGEEGRFYTLMYDSTGNKKFVYSNKDLRQNNIYTYHNYDEYKTDADGKNFVGDAQGNLQILKQVVFDTCADECHDQTEAGKEACRTCRLAELVWGNCERHASTNLNNALDHNQIKKPVSGHDTLLYWFAQNTGTDRVLDSCADTTCPLGFTNVDGECINTIDLSLGEHRNCKEISRISVGKAGADTNPSVMGIDPSNPGVLQNCCFAGKDKSGNCCTTGSSAQSNGVAAMYSKSGSAVTIENICTADSSDYYQIVAQYGNKFLACVGTVVETPGTGTDGYPSGTTLTCNGQYVLVEVKGDKYYYDTATMTAQNFYNCFKTDENADNQKQIYSPLAETGKWMPSCSATDGTFTGTCSCGLSTDVNFAPQNWQVQFIEIPK